NVRTPSGVSYVLENREIMMRLFPDAFAGQSISPVGNYPERLLENLRAVAPSDDDDAPVVVLLTPGRYNSAYFEHVFLAEQMGIELVEGGDLFVRDGYVWMRTTEGPVKVDVIYRRVDDAFMDPLAFRPDSVLAVPGLLSVVRSGRVALANALGTGVADDKAMYIYVPRMIEFYLGEHAILNNVHTYMLRDPKQRQHVFANLHNLVVKEVQGSGGYGMLIGPASTAEEREAYKLRVMRNPDNYIAQPTLALSTAPTLIDGEIAPRHVDLRPFVLSGKGDERDPRRLDPRSTSQRLPSDQFEPGRRHQGHLGSGARLMLSRTAENLFWMARDMERAENTARMLDVSFRMALLPSTIDKQALHFEPIFAIAPGDGRFHELYNELTHESIIRYVALEPANPASIWSLIKLARENARAQRSAISSEAWESLNQTW